MDKNEQYRAGFEAAEHSLKRGEEYPYDSAGPAKDWAHAAARGILHDLNDRRGIKHELRAVEPDVRDELTASLADIIRTASKREASTEPSAKLPSDDEIERAALKHVAVSWQEMQKVRVAAGLSWNYRDGEQFARLKAFAHELAGAGALPDEAKDAALLDALDSWVARNQKEGHRWFTFGFTLDGTAREQIATDLLGSPSISHTKGPTP